MLFKEFGRKEKPALVLIHGGGLSFWMWQPQIDALKNDYRIITPILDGHGEDFETPFVNIQDCADKIITYIKENCGGKVYAICGLSIGAQITVEILSRESSITQKALIESAMVIPMKSTQKLAKVMIHMSFSLIQQKWFSKLQARQLYITKKMFDSYFEDAKKMTELSMLNMILENAKYTMPKSFKKTTAEIIILVGAKEYKIMKRSGKILYNNANNAQYIEFKGCAHGVSVKCPDAYLTILNQLFRY